MPQPTPTVSANPFVCPAQPMTGKPSVHDALRSAGPLVRAEAPAGGPAWVITDEALGRRVLNDPRFVKEPALAPESWHGVDDGLDFPVPELRQFTIISVDGEDHRRLRRIHAPAFTPRRLARSGDRITTIARNLFADAAEESDRTGVPAELIDGFAFHFPLLVICDLLGVSVTDPQAGRAAIGAMKAMALGTSDGDGPETGTLDELIGQAVADARAGADTMTGVLFERSCAEFGAVSDDQLKHMVIGLIFAGHDTTGSFLGFLLAETIAGRFPDRSDAGAVGTFVEEALRYHPPVPYTLWRFAADDVEIAGERLPAGSPVLIDIEGINNDPSRIADPELCPARRPAQNLTFGDGPHYCIGNSLARIEAEIMISVLDEQHPMAELAVPFDELSWGRAGSQTARLDGLPVWLNGRPDSVRAPARTSSQGGRACGS